MSGETHRTRHRADATIRETHPEKCKIFPGTIANLNSSFGRNGVWQKRVKRYEANVDVDVSPDVPNDVGVNWLAGGYVSIMVGHGRRETVVINSYIYYYCAGIIESK